MTDKKIKTALLSVSDKTNIVVLAKALQKQGIKLISTGGTADFLRQAGLTIQSVSEYTGFPEIMDGRVKTLHPKIHGGLLGRRGVDEEVMQAQGIEAIDLLVVNLYPFTQTVATASCDLKTAIEQIDIGGPSLLRAGAKNYESVTVLTDPIDYFDCITELVQQTGNTTLETRFKLAQKAFSHSANYEMNIANYLNQCSTNSDTSKPCSIDFPQLLTLQFSKKQDLRYGENPHQKAAFYIDSPAKDCTIANAYQHQGKELSFNNIVDINAALECINLFDTRHACVIVKHANPCGVALGNTQLNAYERAFATDPTSAFGGIIAFNQTVCAKTAATIIQNQFLEVFIAPEIDKEALRIFSQKPNLRVLSTGLLKKQKNEPAYIQVNGGLLVQEKDTLILSAEDLSIVTTRAPTAQEREDLLFAWKVVKCVKSNAIVYAKDQATMGIGAGQMSRVFSSIIAKMKAHDAGFNLKGSVMASDAFFPFKDSIETAAKAGISAIIQPGGSIRDPEVIQTANTWNLAMVFTHIRHFKH